MPFIKNRGIRTGVTDTFEKKNAWITSKEYLWLGAPVARTWRPLSRAPRASVAEQLQIINKSK